MYVRGHIGGNKTAVALSPVSFSTVGSFIFLTEQDVNFHVAVKMF